MNSGAYTYFQISDNLSVPLLIHGVNASLLLNIKTLYMKKEKLYFSEEINEEMAYTKSYLIDEMKERELPEIKVSEAIRELKTDYYFCKAVGEIGMKGKEYEPCGKECETYEPRNGKNGCCKHRGFCYEPSEQKFILKINGKLSPLPF